MRHKDYVDMFSEDMVEIFAPHQPSDHSLNLNPGSNSLDSQIYNLSEVRLITRKVYIKTYRATGLIQGSLSPAAAAMMIAKN